jgi:hypothetical protein
LHQPAFGLLLPLWLYGLCDSAASAFIMFVLLSRERICSCEFEVKLCTLVDSYCRRIREVMQHWVDSSWL